MLLVSLALALVATTVAGPDAREAAVRAAIAQGVAERMGPDARVTVDQLEIRVPVARGHAKDGAPATPGNPAGVPAKDSVVRGHANEGAPATLWNPAGVPAKDTVARGHANEGAPATAWNPAGVPAKDTVRAVLPPGARTGRLVSVVLYAGTVRLGTATAIVRVRAPHVRATRHVARDAELTALDTTDLVADIEGVLFERLPGPADLVGARVRRDVAAGEPLTRATVETALAVRSGDSVEVVARLGIVEARGVGKASGSGHVGDRVRVSRPGQPGLAAARIVAPGVVELIGTFVQVPGARSRQVEGER